jgi:Peptidase A4 family
MLSNRLIATGALAAVAVLLQLTDAPNPSAITLLSRRSHAPIQVIGIAPDGSVSSSNWSGYAATGGTGSVSVAKGSWVVPKVSCSGTAYSAFWVGIDGYSSRTVEQTGTDSDCSGGSPRYYAWYEFYPQASHLVSGLNVSPGDKMYAEITFSGGKFKAYIKNESTGKSSTHTSSIHGDRKSAEWIAEAPSSAGGELPLANFGTVLFGKDHTSVADTNYATINGKSKPVGSLSSVDKITMNGGGSDRAIPSALSSDKTSFSVAKD